MAAKCCLGYALTAHLNKKKVIWSKSEVYVERKKLLCLRISVVYKEHRSVFAFNDNRKLHIVPIQVAKPKTHYSVRPVVDFDNTFFHNSKMFFNFI